MSVSSALEKTNNAFKPYYTLLLMFVFFISTTIAVYRWIVRPQDLSIFIEEQEVNFPNSINDKYNTVMILLVTTVKTPRLDLTLWRPISIYRIQTIFGLLPYKMKLQNQ